MTEIRNMISRQITKLFQRLHANSDALRHARNSRSKKSELQELKSECRSPNTEIRKQNKEDRVRTSDIGKLNSKVRRQR